MEDGLRLYPEAGRILAARMPNYKPPVDRSGEEPIAHESFEGFESKAAAFGDARLTELACPVCGGQTAGVRWVNQGDQRYMALGECPTAGKLLVRLKFRKADDCTWSATRLTYQATDSMESYYKAKAAQPRKRGRGKSRRRPAKTAQSAPQ